MTVYTVISSGGEWDSYWTATEGCFMTYELAQEYVDKRKKLIKKIQGDEEEFDKMLEAFCYEINKDGRQENGYYFNVYRDSFEDWITKLETYKERNETIGNFFKNFDRNYIKQMHVFYMEDCMLNDHCRACNFNFYIKPMHVITSLSEISENV